MTAYPIASDVSAALRQDAPIARTALAAQTLAGVPVFLAADELPDGYSSMEAAEEDYPGLYGDGRFELIWREDQWRIIVRYWRVTPPAPAARSATAAMRRPLGSARNPEEARAILGVASELVSEPLLRRYRTLARARAACRHLLDVGLARVEETEGGYAILVSYWRPVPTPGRSTPLAPAERSELAERAAAPLRPVSPQADPYVGLFERLAPENPAIVLAEEGDGRTRGE